MYKIWKWLRDNIRGIVVVLIVISGIALILGIILLFFCACWITKEQIVTGILVPMICALIGASIAIAMDNSLSNEKLKLALERLEWWWKYRYKNEKGKRADGTKTDGFDKEYKLIYKNWGKSSDEIKEQMKDDKYWDEKFSSDALRMRTSKEKALKSWIEDHFIY